MAINKKVRKFVWDRGNIQLLSDIAQYYTIDELMVIFNRTKHAMRARLNMHGFDYIRVYPANHTPIRVAIPSDLYANLTVSMQERLEAYQLTI